MSTETLQRRIKADGLSYRKPARKPQLNCVRKYAHFKHAKKFQIG